MWHDVTGSMLWDQMPDDYRKAACCVVPEERLRAALRAALEQVHVSLGERKKVFPQVADVFSALAQCPFAAVRVVILGQDPYIQEGQAHGLSFSVMNGKPPPSLANILKRIKENTTVPPVAETQRGNLTGWARQGVLLLNTCLSVQAGAANSHSDAEGWPVLTSAIVTALSRQREKIVFMLWGRPAQRFAEGIDTSRHLVLCASHPSPLGCTAKAPVPFATCTHFSACNAHLQALGQEPICW